MFTYIFVCQSVKTVRVYPDPKNSAFCCIFNQNDHRIINQCVLNDAIPKDKKSLVRFLKLKLYFQNMYCIKLPNISVSSNIFWENIPQNSKGDATVGELDTASLATTYPISAYLVVIIIIVPRFVNIAEQMILRSFLKCLVNLTRRRVSHQVGLVRQALKYQALSLLYMWFL